MQKLVENTNENDLITKFQSDQIFNRTGVNYLNSKTFKKLNLKKDLVEKILQTSKTATTVAGCQKLSTRVVSILGNYNGIIGLGFGKSTNKIKAHQLSFYKGKNQLITVPLTKNRSIPLFTWARFCASTIKLYPVTNHSGGLKVNGPTKTILELAGLKNITAVKLGSSNIFNTASATFLALSFLVFKIERLLAYNSYHKKFFTTCLLNSNKFVK